MNETGPLVLVDVSASMTAGATGHAVRQFLLALHEGASPRIPDVRALVPGAPVIPGDAQDSPPTACLHADWTVVGDYLGQRTTVVIVSDFTPSSREDLRDIIDLSGAIRSQGTTVHAVVAGPFPDRDVAGVLHTATDPMWTLTRGADLGSLWS